MTKTQASPAATSGKIALSGDGAPKLTLWGKFKSRKKINRSTGGNIAVLVGIGVLSLVMVLPIWLMIVNAFKPMEELFVFPPRLYVSNPTFNNFFTMGQLLSNQWVPFSRYLFNSVFVSVVATIAHVFIASMAAYPLAKHHFVGKKVLNQIIVIALLFTQSVLQIPVYMIMAKLGFINTYLALILPVVQMSLGVFLMKQFMGQIPDSLIEAAQIDGAKEFTIWWKIIMPAVKPAWLTMSIFAFIGIWNSTGGNYIYDETMKVLPTILPQIIAGGIARAGAGGAASLFMILPPVLLFVATQSNVIETMTTSGIKD